MVPHQEWSEYEFPVSTRYVEPTAPVPESAAVSDAEWRDRKKAGAKRREFTEEQIEERRARDRARYQRQKAEGTLRPKRPAARSAETKAVLAAQARERWAARTPEQVERDRVRNAERQRIRRARARGESSA